MTLRVLFTPPATGPENMALDQALLSSVARGHAPATLRLYRWRGPWVSVGYAQPFDQAVDLAACRAAGAGVVRRPTGGKALLHGFDLTYSLMLPPGDPLVHANVARSYVSLSKVLVDAFSLVGVEAALARNESGLDPSVRACFEEHRVETVCVGGKKLIGSAQVRRDGGLLQHGSLPLSCDYDLLATLFTPPGTAPAEFAASHRRRVTSLREAAPGVHPEDFAAAMVAAFARNFGGAFAGDVAEEEQADAERLAAGIDVIRPPS